MHKNVRTIYCLTSEHLNKRLILITINFHDYLYDH